MALEHGEAVRAFAKALRFIFRGVVEANKHDLRGADLRGADLRGADLRSADLREAALNDAKLIGADLTEASLCSAQLVEADLSDSILKDADLSGVNLCLASLANAELRGANLVDAGLVLTRLDNAIISFADLRGADLPQARMENASFWKSDLSNTNLRDACLAKASLQEVQLRNADLREVDLRNADVRDSDLSNADLTGAVLLDARLKGVSLMGARLRDADLSGADLREATGLRLDDTCAEKTKFDKPSFYPWGGPDYWIQLRSSYTGTKLMFHLLFLVAFLLPLVARTLFWVGVSDGQAGIEQVMVALQDRVDELEERAALIGPPCYAGEMQRGFEIVQKYVDDPDVARCLSEECKSQSVAETLLRLDRGWWPAVLAGLLILYNVARWILTYFVSARADQERYDHRTPPRNRGFRFLVVAHYVLFVLFVVAAASALWQMASWLAADVWVPA